MADAAACGRPALPWTTIALLVALGLVPIVAKIVDQPFYVTLFTRIVIFAIAAAGLNLILGYGAMVSFGHSLYLGIGAYAVGILSYHGIGNGWAHLAAALAIGAVAATIVGLAFLPTTGVAFRLLMLAL